MPNNLANESEKIIKLLWRGVKDFRYFSINFEHTISVRTYPQQYMATHHWILPWLALLLSVAACAAALWRAKPLDSIPSLPSKVHWIQWAIAIICGVIVGWKIGIVSSTDFVADRGFLLGCVGGAAVVFSSRRSYLIGLAASLLTVAIGRLWLTHAELTGLTSLVIGVAVSVLCLRSGDSWDIPFASILVAAVFGLTAIVGFTRAESIADNYWADIPLIIGGVSLLAAAFSPRPLVPVAFGVVVAAILYWYLAKTWAPFAALAIGRIVAGIGSALGKRNAEDSLLASAVAVALVIAGATAAFLLAAGYGIGLFAIGALLVVIGNPVADSLTFSVASFPAILVAYRLAMLSALDSTRSTGPGDIWDLIAIGLGLIAVVILAELLSGKRPWSAMQFLFAATLPMFALAYLWQPRAMAGLFVGAAIGALAISVFGNSDRYAGQAKRILISGLVLSAVQLEIMPLLANLSEPTRTDRLALVGILAAIAVARAFLPTRPANQPLTEA